MGTAINRSSLVVNTTTLATQRFPVVLQAAPGPVHFRQPAIHTKLFVFKIR
jgi:hypothetical protein